MVWPWFSAEEEEGEGVAVVGFVQRLVAATMRCFFGCFRGKDSHPRLISTPRENTMSYNNNALSSIFLSDDDSPGKGKRGLNPLPEELEVKELMNEAKFLKACGTLLDTPVEIRKASGKWVDTSSRSDETKSWSFKSWLPNSSCEKQPDESPTKVRMCQECMPGSDSLIGTPSRSISCTKDAHKTRRDSIKSIQCSDFQNAINLADVSDNETSSGSCVSPEVFPISAQEKYKSVRFECESETYSSGSSNSCSERSGSAGNRSSWKTSPYPTPLKLTDEMQTPGTVFPAYLDNMTGWKTGRIRSQYVYSVLNPVDFELQEEELKDDNSDSSNGRESLEPNYEVALTSTPTSGMSAKDLSFGKDRKDEASSSTLLKPHLVNHDHANGRYDSTVGNDIHYGTTPGTRPVVGTAAAHSNDNVGSHSSPNCWNGNGIPNTTNKYKEDKEVSWHTTPFEERLEKVLSNETSISRRKPIVGMAMVKLNDETAESDTACTEQPPSAHLKSVVSF